jgi:hypothetical protein
MKLSDDPFEPFHSLAAISSKKGRKYDNLEQVVSYFLDPINIQFRTFLDIVMVYAFTYVRVVRWTPGAILVTERLDLQHDKNLSIFLNYIRATSQNPRLLGIDDTVTILEPKKIKAAMAVFDKNQKQIEWCCCKMPQPKDLVVVKVPKFQPHSASLPSSAAYNFSSNDLLPHEPVTSTLSPAQMMVSEAKISPILINQTSAISINENFASTSISLLTRSRKKINTSQALPPTTSATSTSKIPQLQSSSNSVELYVVGFRQQAIVSLCGRNTKYFVACKLSDLGKQEAKVYFLKSSWRYVVKNRLSETEVYRTFVDHGIGNIPLIEDGGDVSQISTSLFHRLNPQDFQRETYSQTQHRLVLELCQPISNFINCRLLIYGMLGAMAGKYC